MAVVMVFRLAWRITRDLGGARSEKSAWRYVPLLLAGLIAAGSLINSGGFISDNALGYSEGLATALMFIAVERYMDGAPRQALVISFFSALDRPELWIFWGPYALFVFWRDPGARRLVVALAALIFVLWFLFPLWGAGSLLAGITRALHPRSNSAAFTSCPVCTVFKQEAWPEVLNRVKIPAILGLIAAAVGLWRTRGSWWRTGEMSRDVSARAWLLGIGLFGFVWWFGIALETQLGFSGNGRYLVLGTAPVAIAGGVAWGWFAQTVPRVIRSLAARAPSLRAARLRRLRAPRRQRRRDRPVPGDPALDQPERHQPAAHPSRAAVPGPSPRGPRHGNQPARRPRRDPALRPDHGRGLPGADGRLRARRAHAAESRRSPPGWWEHRGRTRSSRIATHRARHCCQARSRSSRGSTTGRATPRSSTSARSTCSRPAPVRRATRWPRPPRRRAASRA